MDAIYRIATQVAFRTAFERCQKCGKTHGVDGRWLQHDEMIRHVEEELATAARNVKSEEEKRKWHPSMPNFLVQEKKRLQRLEEWYEELTGKAPSTKKVETAKPDAPKFDRRQILQDRLDDLMSDFEEAEGNAVRQKYLQREIDKLQAQIDGIAA